MKTIRSIQLFFQEGASDKVYNAAIVEDGGLYTVTVEWGRRNAANNKGTKAAKVSLEKAEKELEKIIREKTTKGYQAITEEVQPEKVAPPVGKGSASRIEGRGRKRLAQAAQLLNPIEDDLLEKVMKDAKMIAQQKLDGTRVLVHVAEEVVATNRNGQITTLAEAIKSCVGEAPQGTILDGEVVATPEGPQYFVFDLLQHGTEDLRELGYFERHSELDVLVDQLSGPVKLVGLAMTLAEKRALFKKLRESRAEGIVFKRKDAPYTAGRPSSGGAHLKYKFIKTADVFITKNAGNAYQMAAYDGKRVREVGKVFAGTTNQTRKEIDALLGRGARPVVEVQYLYATNDDILFQPVFVGLRDDKAPEDCTIGQLVHTNREVHDG